jgi:hypothetical protein
LSSLLTLDNEQHEEVACIENEPASLSGKDAETQCDPKILFDAEIQCEKLVKRSIAIQTLALRKNKSRKTKQYRNNLNNSCPIATSTPSERKGQNSSTSRALCFNGPVALLPSMQVDCEESDAIITLSGSKHVLDDSSSSDDSSNSDVISDSDEDYICSELESSDESEGKELKNEKKFIVFESMLDQLFINCKTCRSLCEIEKSNTGSMVAIKATCCNNHTFHWKSQPELHNKPAGNILIPAATVITGGSYESLKQFSNALNLNFVNKDQFYDVQDKIVFPVISNAYKNHRRMSLKK